MYGEVAIARHYIQVTDGMELEWIRIVSCWGQKIMHTSNYINVKPCLSVHK